MNIAARIAELEKAVGAVPGVARSIAQALRSKLLGEGEKPPAVMPSADEHSEAAQTDSAPAPDGLNRPDVGLPETYGRDRLVMLVVDPHQVHAYWEVTTQKLAEAQRIMDWSSLPPAVLRFHGVAGSESPADSFDVPVNLQSRNWYVHLWTPDRSYYAELGLKSDSGQFVCLAKSNEVRTPRAWPVMQVKEHFTQVDAAQRRGEPVSPPAFVRPPREQPVVKGDPPFTSHARRAAQNLVVAPPPAESDPPARINSEEIVKRRLTELLAFRVTYHGRPQIREASSAQASGSNLTDLAEKYFVAGIFSRAATKTADKA